MEKGLEVGSECIFSEPRCCFFNNHVLSADDNLQCPVYFYRNPEQSEKPSNVFAFKFKNRKSQAQLLLERATHVSKF